jgi:hypothetical protein
VTPDRLYHFTCDDGHARIGRYNCLIMPQGHRHPVAGWPPLSWFTTETEPDREATGLAAVNTTCDRMAHRYVITDLSRCTPWLTCPWRPETPQPFLKVMEEFGDVEHWWVSDTIVAAEWDRGWELVKP